MSAFANILLVGPMGAGKTSHGKWLARQLGLSERTVLERLRYWLEQGVIKRLGVIVRHRALGYRANAMVVWDIPDAEVSAVGRLARKKASASK